MRYFVTRERQLRTRLLWELIPITRTGIEFAIARTSATQMQSCGYDSR